MAFKGIDFSKLLNQTPEEKEARRAENEAREKQADLDSMQNEVLQRAGKSTQRLSFKVEEFQFLPEYGKRQGVFIHGTNAKNERVGVLVSPLEREDYREFQDRFRNLEAGSTMVADGLYEQRRWKDNQDQWRSTSEFQALMPVAPEGLTLRKRLPDDVKIMPSSFTSKQHALAQSQGMSR